MSGTFARDKRDKRDKNVPQTTRKGGTNGTSVYIQCPCPALMSRFGRLEVDLMIGVVVVGWPFMLVILVEWLR
jgi:hypothetical protein